MPLAPINFGGFSKVSDKATHTRFARGQYDGYWTVDDGENGPRYVWNKRPGLESYWDLVKAAPIDGLWEWPGTGVIYTVCDGTMSEKNGSVETTYAPASGYPAFEKNKIASFAEFRSTYFYVANGGKIAKLLWLTSFEWVADGDAPTYVKSICTTNQILVAARDFGDQFDWADAGSPDDWTSQYATAEAKPDQNHNMLLLNDYLHFFGERTYEPWRWTGSTFNPEKSGIMDRGTIAEDSPTIVNNRIFWLDNYYKPVMLEGFTLTEIGNPVVDSYINTFEKITDAVGYPLFFAGKHFWALSFPTAKKTLVYDIDLRAWMEWSYWNVGTGTRGEWRGRQGIYQSRKNRQLIGDRSNGVVWKLTGTTDNGAPIITEITSDESTRGDPNRLKQCHSLSLHFKRADTNTTPKKMYLSWADDGSTDFCSPIQVPIQEQGKIDLFVKVTELGSYYSRRWRIQMSDAIDVGLVNEVLEDFEYGY